MSSNSFDATIELRLKPSARAHHLLFWLHALPLMLLPLAMQPSLAMTAVAILIGGSWIWLRRHPAFGYGPRALRRIVWHPDGRWSLWRGNGTELSAEIAGNSYLHPRLTILNFSVPGQRACTRVLLGDEAAENLLTRLRARLSALRTNA